MQKITPFLWFNHNAQEAANYYITIFKNSKILASNPMTVEFELEGQRFLALNGGPEYKFNEAVSFYINCETQDEVDYYWNRLSEGGDEKAQQCGWLKDKYGVSWQVIPSILGKLLGDPDPVKSQSVMQAMLKMKKIEVIKLIDAVKK